MTRRQRRNNKYKAYVAAKIPTARIATEDQLNVAQVKDVQGPQRYKQEPQIGRVELTADLAEKYLGAGLIGFAPYLEVLNNKAGDELLCKHGYDLYRRMLTDSEVEAAVNALIQATNSQPFKAISPLNPDDTDYKLSQELADVVNWVFTQFDFDEWREDQLRQTLTFGNAVSEVDWDVPECGPWEGHFTIKRLR